MFYLSLGMNAIPYSRYDDFLFIQDVHETAAGALWNLAFYSGNALRIVEEGGVPILVRLCSSSGSKMARFMSALALAYMFDGRYVVFQTDYFICLLLNYGVFHSILICIRTLNSTSRLTAHSYSRMPIDPVVLSS